MSAETAVVLIFGLPATGKTKLSNSIVSLSSASPLPQTAYNNYFSGSSSFRYIVKKISFDEEIKDWIAPITIADSSLKFLSLNNTQFITQSSSIAHNTPTKSNPLTNQNSNQFIPDIPSISELNSSFDSLSFENNFKIQRLDLLNKCIQLIKSESYITPTSLPSNDKTLRFVYLIDDVFTYFSMRKAWFNTCCKNNWSFMQIYLTCPKELRNSRNIDRALFENSHSVPQGSMDFLESRFEPPFKHPSWWEKQFTLPLSNGENSQSSLTYNSFKAMEFVHENLTVFKNKIYCFNHDLQIRQESKLATSASPIHQYHLILKNLVSVCLNDFLSDKTRTSNSVKLYASSLNDFKNSLFKNIKKNPQYWNKNLIESEFHNFVHTYLN
ncbi:L-seryl-tRNA(Sec) kinase [Smittium culicis]|uniref:L-seryl-tRNA(Sec) kinase n=1 Tax=Smittium culicis TaxID=133412 RepID=A0A1R1Y6K7_9FUNG|nr:L-seryl-tRNA(Sec) kinase [Smittium culicis]